MRSAKLTFPLFLLISFIAITIANFFTTNSRTDHVDCLNSLNKEQCYAEFLREVTLVSGPEKSFHELKLLAAVDKTIEEGSCHQLVHVIGRTSMNKYGDFAEAVRHNDDYCLSGYYHGIMEAFVAETGKERVLEKINDLCATIPGKERRGFDYWNCLHGIGHGTMLLSYENLIEALKLCDYLNGIWEQQQCYNGVFMQNIVEHGNDFVQEKTASPDPFFPCSSIEEKYRGECYYRQPFIFLSYSKGDFKKSFDLCSTLENEDYRISCYRGLGREAFGVEYGDINSTINACYQGENSTQKQYCVGEASEYFVRLNRNKLAGDSFCNKIDAENLRTTCLEHVRKYIKNF